MLLTCFHKEFVGRVGVQVAEVSSVHYLHVRTDGVLRAVQIQVAIGGLWVFVQAVHQVERKAVRHPDASVAQISVPVLRPRLFGAAGSRHCEYSGQSLQPAYDVLAVAGFCDDKQFVECHLFGGLPHHVGSETLAGWQVAPSQFVISPVFGAVSMSAPIQQHIMPFSSVGRKHYRQPLRLLSCQYVGYVLRG